MQTLPARQPAWRIANRPPRICIIGLEDYGLLMGKPSGGYVGGETVQHVLLARAWQGLGIDVSIIVFDHGQGRVCDCEGLRLIAAHAQDAGLPGLRFVHPRMTGMLTAMRLADADLYYQSLAGVHTGLAAWFCRRQGRRLVFRVSSDAYCVPDQQLIRYKRDRRIYEYGLRRADLILTQTEHQRRLLRTHYALQSELANMAVEVPAVRRRAPDIDVLWVSNFRAVKRPELVLELARRLPQRRFVLVGGGDEHYAQRTHRAAAGLANVEFTGPVAYEAIGAYFDRARIFLNTSSVEGFPNTFLQAWIRGVPVLTFFDPDGLVARQGLGIAAGSHEEMVQVLANLEIQEPALRAAGERAIRYARAHHATAAVARSYLELFCRHFGELFMPAPMASTC